MNKYWMVHKIGPGSGVPSKMHDTYDLACTEAKRFARLFPGCTFTVLEARTAYKTEEPLVVAVHISEIEGSLFE